MALEGAVDVLCIRHAQTQGYHIVDTVLSADGERACASLRAAAETVLRGRQVRCVLASSLRRAMSTARLAFPRSVPRPASPLAECEPGSLMVTPLAAEVRRTPGDCGLAADALQRWAAAAGLSACSESFLGGDGDDGGVGGPGGEGRREAPDAAADQRRLEPETRARVASRVARLLDLLATAGTGKGAVPPVVVLVAHANLLQALFRAASDRGWHGGRPSGDGFRFCEGRWLRLRPNSATARGARDAMAAFRPS